MIKDAKIPDEQIVCNVGVGNAKDEILEYARQIDADLIAIASHRPNVSSFLLIRLNSIIYCSPCKNVGIGDPLVKKPL